MTGRKTFAVGETLSAGEVNGYLMDQVVAEFDNPTQRATQWPAPQNGALSYLRDVRRIETYETATNSWTCRQALGLLPGGRVTSTATVAAGTTAGAEYGITGLVSAVDLKVGRVYRARTDLLYNAGVAAQRVTTYVRGRKTALSGSTDVLVASGNVPVATTGTAGRVEVEASGVFGVTTDGTYQLGAYLLGAATPPAVLPTSKGVMELTVEDVGQATADMSLPLLS